MARLYMKKGFSSSYKESLKFAGKKLEQAIFLRGSNVAKQCLEDLKMKSQDLCPVATGKLRDSALIEEVTNTRGKSQSFKLSYNTGREDGSYNYAYKIHEGVELNFNTDKNPKAQAKFLEQPYRENLPVYVEKIKASLESVLK